MERARRVQLRFRLHHAQLFLLCVFLGAFHRSEPLREEIAPAANACSCGFVVLLCDSPATTQVGGCAWLCIQHWQRRRRWHQDVPFPAFAGFACRSCDPGRALAGRCLSQCALTSRKCAWQSSFAARVSAGRFPMLLAAEQSDQAQQDD